MLLRYYLLYRNLDNDVDSLYVEPDKIWIRTVSNVSMYITGFFLALVRLMDSFNWAIITNYAKELYGYAEKRSIKGKEVKPLNYYLTQSLNLELINIILQSIYKFAKSSDFFFDDDYEQYERINDLNFYDTKHYKLRKINLDRVEISNQWNVEDH